MGEGSLHGLTIAVTRPREQAAQLAKRIEQAGGKALLFPLLEITELADKRTLHEQCSRLAQFNLAIFISPNAVRHGMAAIRTAGVLPANLGIATIGQSSSKALRESGIAKAIAPTERFDSEGLLDLPEIQNVAGWRVMIFCGDGGRELLADTLRSRGALVEYATCYQRSKPQQDVRVLLDAKPDAITVTSSEALTCLWQMLDGEVKTMNLPLFVPHARIAALARQQGWQQVHLSGAGDEGLFTALTEWAKPFAGR